MKTRKFGWSIVGCAIALVSLFPNAAQAQTAAYSVFAGNYIGRETFHYPGLGLEGQGRARLKMSTSQGGAGGMLSFNRSLHVAGRVFPFTERTRFSPQGEFRSAITVPNFANFGTAAGRVRVLGNAIRFTASYRIAGTSSSLVQAAKLTVKGRKLTYRVVVEFATPAGLQRVAVFTFIGRRAN